MQRELVVRKDGCRPRGRPTYATVRVSGQMPVSSFRVRGGQQGWPSWEEGGGSAGSGVLVRRAPGTELSVGGNPASPPLPAGVLQERQGARRRGCGLRTARRCTPVDGFPLVPLGGLHGVQEAGQGGVGSPPVP